MLRLLSGVLSCGLVVVASATTGPLAIEDRNTRSRGAEAAAQAQAVSQANENALLMFMQQFEQQQQEIALLRGQIEELTHALEDQRRAERERYLDVDGRLSALEARKTGATATADGTALPTAPAQDQAAQEALYNEARTALRSREYSAAISKFQQYLKSWPRGDFADYAHYWLGETYMTQGGAEQAKATAEFKAVVDNFPTSQQTPRALYRLGQINLDANKLNEARQYFTRVVEQYPTSADANNAKAVLAQLK